MNHSRRPSTTRHAARRQESLWLAEVTTGHRRCQPIAATFDAASIAERFADRCWRLPHTVSSRTSGCVWLCIEQINTPTAEFTPNDATERRRRGRRKTAPIGMAGAKRSDCKSACITTDRRWWRWRRQSSTGRRRPRPVAFATERAGAILGGSPCRRRRSPRSGRVARCRRQSRAGERARSPIVCARESKR